MMYLEELERRDCPSAVCDANPTYQAECAYLDNLVPQSAITITAVQSGNWSNPATWGGRLPGKGDKVWIPNGVAVTVDGQQSPALLSILDNGILSFATNANTSLTVNTLVVGTDVNRAPTGELDIGTASDPIQAGFSAQLIFADSQSVVAGETQAQLFPDDSDVLSGGLISMGTLNIYGSEVTPYVNLLASAQVGSTVLSLDSVPVGWKAGDTLLIPGTDPGQTQTEQIQIAAINGNRVTLAAPLQYTHSAPAGQSVQIADENRNVIIEDQGTATQYADGSDGHVMQMHNDACAIQYAAFLDPGRTDKSVPLGGTLANGTVNHAGRYSLHFHRDYYPGLTDNDPAIQVVGCYQANGVGWGYDNHSSNVDFVNDVAFNDFGSAFVDEAGNELGSYQGCLVVQIPGTAGSNVDGRSSIGDFGFNGYAFWLVSAQTSVNDCHVWDANEAYYFFTQFLPNQPSSAKAFYGIEPSNITLASFSNDTAGEVNVGLDVYWRLGTAVDSDVYSNFACWDIGLYGVESKGYVASMDMQNFKLSAANPHADAFFTLAVTAFQRLYTFDNWNVSGDFAMGANLPASGTDVINGGSWDAQTAFSIPYNQGPRQIDFEGNIGYGPDVQTRYALAAAPLQNDLVKPRSVSPEDLFSADQILLPDGSQLYRPDQLPGYIPVAAGSGVLFAGLTNAQLYSQYGFAIGGEVAPANTTPYAGSNGYEGAVTPFQTTYWLNGTDVGTTGSSFTPKYLVLTEPSTVETPNQGQVYTAASAVLQAGWNFFLDGNGHSWLVWGS